MGRGGSFCFLINRCTLHKTSSVRNAFVGPLSSFSSCSCFFSLFECARCASKLIFVFAYGLLDVSVLILMQPALHLFFLLLFRGGGGLNTPNQKMQRSQTHTYTRTRKPPKCPSVDSAWCLSVPANNPLNLARLSFPAIILLMCFYFLPILLVDLVVLLLLYLLPPPPPPPLFIFIFISFLFPLLLLCHFPTHHTPSSTAHTHTRTHTHRSSTVCHDWTCQAIEST